MKPLDHFVQRYGDLLFDFCESTLRDPAASQLAFRAIIKELKRSAKDETFDTYERAWVLRVACESIRRLAPRQGRKLTPGEQIGLNANPGVANRLKHFDAFFHRLNDDEQFILLLRDKYGLPYGEISSALNVPEGSLKVLRQQALRALEEWIWEAAAG